MVVVVVALEFADTLFGVVDGFADVSGSIYLFRHSVCRVQPADPYLLL